MVNTARLRWAVLLVLIAVALVSSVVAVWRGGQTWGGLLNFGSEMAGATVTYVLLEIFVGGRERREAKKTDLIAQLSSDVRDVAVPAIEELSRQGWLYDGSLQRANLNGANLERVSLSRANLVEAYLVGADLSEANLNGASLVGAKLWMANLIRAKLGGADLNKANLIRAKLSGADLNGANLTGADLNRADLNGAKLMGADLSEAKLNGADLRGANLHGAIVTDEQLAQAASFKGATLPDGTKHE